MGNLSFSDLESLAAGAGFPVSLQPIMAAIALAESGGNPNAVNPSDNNGQQSSYGLWQISNGTHSPPSPLWMIPQVNAELAYQKWQTQGLQAWGTYTSGAYLQYLPSGSASTTVTQSLSSPTVVAGQPMIDLNPADWFSQLTSRFGVLLGWIDNPVRLVKLIVGSLILIVSILALWNPPPLRAAVEAAMIPK